MKELKKKIQNISKLGYVTIALDITELNRKDVEELLNRPIFKETKYLIGIAEYVLERMHQAETLENEVTIDYVIKLK